MILPTVLFVIFAVLAAAGAFWLVWLGTKSRRRASVAAVLTLLGFALLYSSLYFWVWPLLTEP